jgi:hypothetical protein
MLCLIIEEQGMNNDTPIRELDARYVVGFDASQWVHIDVMDGPRLNFRQASVLQLHTFLNDPTQQTCIISEKYDVERAGEDAIILHTGNFHYRLSSVAAQRLRDFLNEIIGEEKEGIQQSNDQGHTF